MVALAQSNTHFTMHTSKEPPKGDMTSAGCSTCQIAHNLHAILINLPIALNGASRWVHAERQLSRFNMLDQENRSHVHVSNRTVLSILDALEVHIVLATVAACGHLLTQVCAYALHGVPQPNGGCHERSFTWWDVFHWISKVHLLTALTGRGRARARVSMQY
jgi:hypothetical protein